MEKIKNILKIVKSQRELQVLLLEIKDITKHNLELMKRCQICARQI